jgi:hypothetical protein
MRERIERALTIIAITGLATRPAFAIPSPDLVAGSLLSISQLLALASAILGGGGAVYATARARRHGWGAVVSRGFAIATIVLLVLFCLALALNIYQYFEQSRDQQARLEETLSPRTARPALCAANRRSRNSPMLSRCGFRIGLRRRRRTPC